MAQWIDYDDEDHDDSPDLDAEREAPNEADVESFESRGVERCYECGATLDEDVAMCAACGAFQLADDRAAARRNPFVARHVLLWIVVALTAAAILILAVL